MLLKCLFIYLLTGMTGHERMLECMLDDGVFICVFITFSTLYSGTAQQISLYTCLCNDYKVYSSIGLSWLTCCFLQNEFQQDNNHVILTCPSLLPVSCCSRNNSFHSLITTNPLYFPFFLLLLSILSIYFLNRSFTIKVSQWLKSLSFPAQYA